MVSILVSMASQNLEYWVRKKCIDLLSQDKAPWFVWLALGLFYFKRGIPQEGEYPLIGDESQFVAKQCSEKSSGAVVSPDLRKAQQRSKRGKDPQL